MQAILFVLSAVSHLGHEAQTVESPDPIGHEIGHSLPVEQGRFVRPSLPRHLRRCDLCNTQAVGDELHYVFDCPRFGAIRKEGNSLIPGSQLG